MFVASVPLIYSYQDNDGHLHSRDDDCCLSPLQCSTPEHSFLTCMRSSEFGSCFLLTRSNRLRVPGHIATQPQMSFDRLFFFFFGFGLKNDSQHNLMLNHVLQGTPSVLLPCLFLSASVCMYFLSSETLPLPEPFCSTAHEAQDRSNVSSDDLKHLFMPRK